MHLKFSGNSKVILRRAVVGLIFAGALLGEGIFREPQVRDQMALVTKTKAEPAKEEVRAKVRKEEPELRINSVQKASIFDDLFDGIKSLVGAFFLFGQFVVMGLYYGTQWILQDLTHALIAAAVVFLFMKKLE